MSIDTQRNLFRACSILFGPHIDISWDFLYLIQVSGIKSAYRKKALVTHPDRAIHRDDKGAPTGHAQFVETHWAYQHLLDFVEQRRSIPRRTGATASPFSHRRKRPARPPRRPPPSPGRNRSPGRGYAGGIPNRPLLFGQYLYYTGTITWETLIKAIVWQRHQRPRLGEIAARWGWLSEKQIIHAAKNRSMGDHIGDTLVRQKIITPWQLRVLLHRQSRLQEALGQFFTSHRYLTPLRLEKLLQDFYRHNRLFDTYSRRP